MYWDKLCCVKRLEVKIKFNSDLVLGFAKNFAEKKYNTLEDNKTNNWTGKKKNFDYERKKLNLHLAFWPSLSEKSKHPTGRLVNTGCKRKSFNLNLAFRPHLAWEKWTRIEVRLKSNFNFGHWFRDIPCWETHEQWWRGMNIDCGRKILHELCFMAKPMIRAKNYFSRIWGKKTKIFIAKEINWTWT